MAEPAKTPNTTQYLNGSDITLLLDKGSGKFAPTLGAKSHKIAYKSNTREIVDKDTVNSLYKSKSVQSLDVTISVDGFVKIAPDTNGVVAAELMAAMKAAKPVKLRYGYRENTENKTYEEGMFIIDSFEQTDPAQEESTYSAQFSNTGEIKTVTKAL